jgi:glutamyl-tRNA synthetase
LNVGDVTPARVRVRFAPSPTGRLHAGNIRTALINWLFVRKAGGRFLLRLDDTDEERSRAEYAQAIEEDLRWLGLGWDEFARQSGRRASYDAAVARLKDAGRLYPCYETPEELALKRKAQLAAGRPPIYDRAALALTESDRARLEAEGRHPHWRFRMSGETVAWDDLARGPIEFLGRNLADPVLVRADGRLLYHLTSVVDDVELGVTHVIRGEDHIANTAEHIEMFRALGHEPPAFAHTPLLMSATGEGLSKRAGSLTVAELREQGIAPLGLVSYLAKLGSAQAIEPRDDMAALIAEFDLAQLGRAAPRFDPRELERVNHEYLRRQPFPVVAPLLAPLGLGAVDEALWLAVRGNVVRLTDCREWLAVRDGPIAPVIEEASFAGEAASLLPEGLLDQESWGRWTAAVSAATGRKGKALFRPLRLALTGREHGPEMRNLLPLIGRARALARLAGETI